MLGIILSVENATDDEVIKGFTACVPLYSIKSCIEQVCHQDGDRNHSTPNNLDQHMRLVQPQRVSA